MSGQGLTISLSFLFSCRIKTPHSIRTLGLKCGQFPPQIENEPGTDSKNERAAFAARSNCGNQARRRHPFVASTDTLTDPPCLPRHNQISPRPPQLQVPNKVRAKVPGAPPCCHTAYPLRDFLRSRWRGGKQSGIRYLFGAPGLADF